MQLQPLHDLRQGGVSADHVTTPQEKIDYFIAAAFACALGYSFWVLIEGWSQPLLDIHSFRQTQTAITAFWMTKHSPLVDYQTPVLGAPWTIPFEFPLFQWIAASIYKLFPVTLDSAGRAVSYAFFLAILLPLYRLAILLDLGVNRFFIAAIFLLSSPIYLFWSRTFMIESTALFFSIGFVAQHQQYLTTRRTGDLIGASVAASLAALVKVTVFPPFIVAAALLVSRDVISRRRKSSLVLLIRRYAPIFIPLIVSASCLLVWVHHADALKSESSFGRFLTSAQLSSWNYGSLAQRTSVHLWLALFDRSLRDALGAPIALLMVSGAAIFCSRRLFAYVAALLFLYIVPFMIFTNLHLVHDYYQYENAIFILLATALAISGLRPRLSRWVFLIFLGMTSGGEILAFMHYFEPALLRDEKAGPILLASRAIRQYTPAESAIFVLGDDWSSELPYYSERKGVAFPSWTPDDLLNSMLSQPSSILGGLPLSAIVVCNAGLNEETRLSFVRFLNAANGEFIATNVNGCRAFIRDSMAGLIGTEIRSAFKIGSDEKCRGYVEDARRDDGERRYEVSGWTWSAGVEKVPLRVLLVDSHDIVRGIAYPIWPREDIRRASPEVKSLYVGWRGYADAPEFPLSAYSTTEGSDEVCRLRGTAGQPTEVGK